MPGGPLQHYNTCIAVYHIHKFSITVGPYFGKYKRCGSYLNGYIKKYDTISYSCGDETYGTSVEMKSQGSYLRIHFCEVSVYGRGMVELLICHYELYNMSI